VSIGYSRKCDKGKVPIDQDENHNDHFTRFQKILIILRDPYASVWAEYQREISGMHQIGIDRNSFNRTAWEESLYSFTIPAFIKQQIVVDDIIKTFDNNSFHIVRFEDLMHKNISDRIKLMADVVSFMGYEASHEKLNCSFILADNPTSHRHINKAMVTIADAYSDAMVNCRIWRMIIKETAMMDYGYKPWNNAVCPP
jgi:hypothetical protein